MELTIFLNPYRYMKYLYDYECEKKNLSTRSELDAAIEGNKREGRRASGQYDAQAALAMVTINFMLSISIHTHRTPGHNKSVYKGLLSV